MKPYNAVAMKTTLLSIVCASGLGLFAVNQNTQSDVVAGDFSSPAAEASYVQGGDISSVSSETSFVMDIENATTVQQWTARSTGCSVGCSSGCSFGCRR